MAQRKSTAKKFAVEMLLLTTVEDARGYVKLISIQGVVCSEVPSFWRVLLEWLDHSILVQKVLDKKPPSGLSQSVWRE